MLTTNEKLRIRVRSGVAEETLDKFLDDEDSVREASARRIRDAANAEGIELHPAPRNTAAQSA